MSEESIEIPVDWPIGKQLKVAVKQDLDYWLDRTDKPNLSITMFHAFILALPLNLLVQWKTRESTKGRNGETGEFAVFSFTQVVTFMGTKKKFYCKGYFFSRQKRTGVCIQSFRRV